MATIVARPHDANDVRVAVSILPFTPLIYQKGKWLTRKADQHKNGARSGKLKFSNTYFVGTVTIEIIGKLMGLKKGCKLWENIHSRNVNTRFLLCVCARACACMLVYDLQL
jgi:hypothetical protein